MCIMLNEAVSTLFTGLYADEVELIIALKDLIWPFLVPFFIMMWLAVSVTEEEKLFAVKSLRSLVLWTAVLMVTVGFLLDKATGDYSPSLIRVGFNYPLIHIAVFGIARLIRKKLEKEREAREWSSGSNS